MKLRAPLLALLAIALTSCARGAGSGAEGEDSAPPVDAAAAGESAGYALPADPVPVPEGDPRIALSAKIPGTRPSDLRQSPVPGIYELVHGGEISYLSVDGQYVFSGDLFQVTDEGDFPNLSETRRRELRRQLLAAVPREDTIIFGAADAPHEISVFTDVDCQWCQRMHSQVEQYNELGIRVRYLSYPRTGPDTESWHKAESVWCASDQRAALTAAKQGEEVDSAACEAPIARQFALGQQVGITGTPGVVLESGELIPGYLAPQRMLTAIEESSAAAAAAQ